ncbi:uncharacterized protein LOC116266375 [Nymphaea colorata]|nr:uncharacterized protein LOC116266375 [Nymphaea colorata]XP_031503419.1 uncharacterized protein LOC116266375 [Nymphaea colorata]
MAEDGHKVTLNVYDLSKGLARQLSTTFLGKAIEAIWHTGVVVYGTEYYFGGGIQRDRAGTTPYGTPMKVIDLGVTHVPKDLFEQYLEDISPRYTAETYNLLYHNCNNFSNEVAQFLVGVTIPDYILQLPNEVMSSPMGALIMPMIQRLEMTLRSGSVPQAPQFVPSGAPAEPAVESMSQKTGGSPAKSTVRSTTATSSNMEGSASSAERSAPVTATVGSPRSTKTEKTDAGIGNGAATDAMMEARRRVQEEITREFSALMAAGNLRASEAAALATRKVMERHGMLNASAMSLG